MPRYTSKHTGKKIDDTIDSVVNPNLLDNWYFGNPVDQRQGRIVKPNTTYYSDNQLTTSAGTTSAYVTAYRYATGTTNGVNYASFKLTDSDTAPTYYAAPENVVRGYTGAGYGIDRWRHDKGSSGNGVVLLNENGITIKQGSTVYVAQSLHQIVENPQRFSGETVTLSMLVKGTHRSQVLIFQNGSVLKANSAVVNTEDWTLISLTATLSSTIANLSMFIYGDIGATAQDDYSTILAAKLELGSQQTLAHQDENGNWVMNEIPYYGEQLARCQRHCIEIVPAIDNAYGIIGSGSAQSNNRVFVCVPLPVTMRSAPTVSYTGNWKLVSGTAAGYGFDINWLAFDHISNNSVSLNITTANEVLTVGETYHLWRVPGSKNSMLFSADL